ncbi:MAG: PilT domain-containing protein [Microgenomates group bacterium Gr01-1014_80]|nr:MAG: PilT domain-containing protein [Microgenomates group bacterium Gr01-1014_80]
MKYLLDTHILIWFLQGNKNLKNSLREIIESPENEILLSVVNGIEISIKSRSGKLRLNATLKTIFEKSGFGILSIDLNHILEFNRLPVRSDHKDPFDRMLVSQALVENCILITTDVKIKKYKVATL